MIKNFKLFEMVVESDIQDRIREYLDKVCPIFGFNFKEMAHEFFVTNKFKHGAEMELFISVLNTGVELKLIGHRTDWTQDYESFKSKFQVLINYWNMDKLIEYKLDENKENVRILSDITRHGFRDNYPFDFSRLLNNPELLEFIRNKNILMPISIQNKLNAFTDTKTINKLNDFGLFELVSFKNFNVHK